MKVNIINKSGFDLGLRMRENTPTESEIRLALSRDIDDAVIKAKASAARMIQQAIWMMYADAADKDMEYARCFDEVSKIVRAYVLEMQSTAIG